MIETRMATTSNYGFDLIDCDQDPEMLFGEYAKKDKENWQKTDTVIKNVENKVDKVKSEAGNLVTLDGESKQNFNFIENSVAKTELKGVYDVSKMIDGNTLVDTFGNTNIPLINCQVFGGKLNIPTNGHIKIDNYINTDNFSLFINIEKISPSSTYQCIATFGASSILNEQEKSVSIMLEKSTNSIQVRTMYGQNSSKINYTSGWLAVLFRNNVLTLITKDSMLSFKTRDFDKTKMYLFNSNIYDVGTLEIKNIITYDRHLTQQEIERNLSILNNSPSIKEVHTTDSTGKTSILKLASDTDHVVDRAGRTQEQINRTFYKRMCKEIPSPGGEPITVKNGEEGYVLSAEIKGQTVKNCIDLNTKNSFSRPPSIVEDGIMKFTGSGVAQVVYSKKEFAYVEPNKQYTIIVEVLKNTTGIERPFHINGSSGIFTNATAVGTTTKILVQTVADFSLKQYALDCFLNESVTTGDFWCRIAIVEGDWTNKPISYIPFGLSSTQAIISNNGQQYPIYEPTIQGKTRILNGQLVSLEPSDPTLLNLDSVQDVYDEVNLSMKQLTKKIGDMTLNGSESWIWSAVDSSKNIGYVSLPLEQIAPNQNESILTLNNLFTDINGGEGHGRRKEGLCLTDGKYLRIMYKSGDVRFSNLSTFKQYLADNNLRVKYVLNQPMTQQLTEELVPTILTNQTNILDVGGAVKPSSFKVTVPTTDGVKKEYTLTPINGWTGTAKANLLQTGDAELVLDLTIPEQFNTIICSLPTELRPKAERTVLGYNGNTPVVIKVLPTGEVKCMTQQSGKIELNDTYEI